MALDGRLRGRAWCGREPRSPQSPWRERGPAHTWSLLQITDPGRVASSTLKGQHLRGFKPAGADTLRARALRAEGPIRLLCDFGGTRSSPARLAFSPVKRVQQHLEQLPSPRRGGNTARGGGQNFLPDPGVIWGPSVLVVGGVAVLPWPLYPLNRQGLFFLFYFI